MPQTPQTVDYLGFLSVTEHDKFGIVGGYLILNGTGRPMEFHCTAPVKPSRAQEILYGETLEPYLYGEQIASTLFSRAKTPVSFVMTDTPAVLAVQENCEIPVGFVFPPKKLIKKTEENGFQENRVNSEIEKPEVEISEEFNESLKSFGIEKLRLQSQKNEDELPSVPLEVVGLDTDYWGVFKIGNRIVALPGEDEKRKNKLFDTVRNTARMIDLAEPFTRIRIAIEEAQKAA